MMINRRKFINKLFSGLKNLFCLKLFSLSFLEISAGASSSNNALDFLSGQYSLKEFVQKKMHHGKNYFINPFSRKKVWSPWKCLGLLFSNNHFNEFYKDEPKSRIFIDWEKIRNDKRLSITFIKHACLMIKDGDTFILIDPIFNGLTFFKDFTPLAFDLKDMPKPDYVLITHGHYDHLDKSSLDQLGRHAHVITPLGYKKILNDFKFQKLTELDWFSSFSSDKLEIILLPCNHWTMRNPISGPNRSLWGSFLIRTSGGMTIFVSGDSAYSECFSELGKMFDIDLAIFNLGAYEPRWFMAQSHMNPEETVCAFEELNAKRLFIVHWGTFRLGYEPVHFPPIQLKKALEEKGLVDRLIDIKHGQTLFQE